MSINYLHRGALKWWFRVPASHAPLFEGVAAGLGGAVEDWLAAAAAAAAAAASSSSSSSPPPPSEELPLDFDLGINPSAPYGPAIKEIVASALALAREAGLPPAAVLQAAALAAANASAAALAQRTTLVALSLLAATGVPLRYTLQHQGHFVVTLPGAYHGGFSLGYNEGEAVNFAPLEWFAWAARAQEAARTRSVRRASFRTSGSWCARRSRCSGRRG